VKCLCGQLIVNAPGRIRQHNLAHVARGEAKEIKRTVERNGLVYTFTEFEWIVEYPKQIKWNPLPQNKR